jgi:DNA repair protein RecO (recombination protein O)
LSRHIGGEIMLYKVEGIIIRTNDYGESNKIITLYSKEMGKVAVMARGAKKPKSRLSSISQIFTYGQFLIQKGSGLGVLNQGEIISTYKYIRSDIFKTAYAAYMIELLDKLTEDGKPSVSLFSFLHTTLTHLNNGVDPDVLLYIFELRMLRIAGISPEVNCCTNCNATEGEFSFSIEEGGFLCHRCVHIDPYHIRMSTATARIIRLLYLVDIHRLGKISLKEGTKQNLKIIISAYFEKYSGIHLKSKKFLDQMDLLR